ncbi:MAG: M23 family metallopeptidase, partial [Candidatus Doudnabacteria bacterium]|nr:M23 family metallopeptidase [Candidatus Doudnabacteria bacterium]
MKTKLILTSLIVFSAYFLITVPALAGDLVTVAPPCEFRESDINEVNKARTHHNRSVYQNQGFAVDFGVDGFTPLSCVGRDVFASISGRVTRITDKTVPGGGQMLRIVNPTTGIEVHYLHLANYNGSPANGGFVQQGQKVATIGNTGGTLKEPYPTHLHFEVHRNGQKLSYKSLQDNSNKAEEWRFGNYGVQGPNLSRYDFTYDSQGWQVANAMSFVFDGTRRPKYQVTGNDPFFISPELRLNRVDYRYVDIDVEYSGGLPSINCVRLYILEEGDKTFSESKAFSFSSTRKISDNRGILTFDLRQETNIYKYLTRLRFDPTCGGSSTITLHGIRLYNDLQANAVHRFWSDKHQNHFFTADDAEK